MAGATGNSVQVMVRIPEWLPTDRGQHICCLTARSCLQRLGPAASGPAGWPQSAWLLYVHTRGVKSEQSMRKSFTWMLIMPQWQENCLWEGRNLRADPAWRCWGRLNKWHRDTFHGTSQQRDDSYSTIWNVDGGLSRTELRLVKRTLRPTDRLHPPTLYDELQALVDRLRVLRSVPFSDRLSVDELFCDNTAALTFWFLQSFHFLACSHPCHCRLYSPFQLFGISAASEASLHVVKATELQIPPHFL